MRRQSYLLLIMMSQFHCAADRVNHSKLNVGQSCDASFSNLDDLRRHEELAKSTIVKRLDDEGGVLMETLAIHGIIFPNSKAKLVSQVGEPPWLEKTSDSPKVIPSEQKTHPKVTRIEATWLRTNDASGFAVPTEPGANVFGNLGAIIPKTNKIVIHAIDAVGHEQVLASFGGRLVNHGDTVSFDTNQILFHIEYDFKPQYISKYVSQVDKGGGLFVETHPFPHLFVPMEPGTDSPLILGRKVAVNEFEFLAFQIPYGKAIFIDANVIHGDSFFVGRHAITLTSSEADSVLFRKTNLELADEVFMDIEIVFDDGRTRSL